MIEPVVIAQEKSRKIYSTSTENGYYNTKYNAVQQKKFQKIDKKISRKRLKNWLFLLLWLNATVKVPFFDTKILLETLNFLWYNDNR